MGKIILFIGAARSGKSRLAVEAAKKISVREVAFVATCIPIEARMKKRVALHKKSRPSSWKTIEAETDIARELEKIRGGLKAIIIDCLTLFVSALFVRRQPDAVIKRKVTQLIKQARGFSCTTIIVSGEVGAGVVPDNKSAADFRDLLGSANQIVAGYADEVYSVIAGIPVKIK